MDHVPRISEAEWTVMKVLWNESPLTADDVVTALDDTTSWSPRTIKALLNRLINKKALGFQREGRKYLYYPLAEEAACVRAESKSFLQRVYGGAVTPMLAMFLEEEELTPQEIAELRKVLNRRGRQQR